MALVLDAARRAGAEVLDLTGGAPEMNPHFRRFVEAARPAGLRVIVRTNLTVLLLEGFRNLPGFFARHRVRVVASLPCYREDNVDRQRGRQVHRESIDVLQRLNREGYGSDPTLPLDLVYNPGGPCLPPGQAALEEAYRRELAEHFGVRFTRLIAIANMPIGRFLRDLGREGKDQEYQWLLRESFNPETVDGLMCRHQLHVGWDGTMYDCDFNCALRLPVTGPARHVRDFDPERFLRRRIATASHCFGCTAGQGSSCGGALA
jgi:radical SAM/Cys-rich protein